MPPAKTRPALTKAELELMEAVWRTQEPITSTTVGDHLENNKAWKPTTILTLLGKLKEKGYIAGRKEGKSYRYQILSPREQYRREETKGLVERFYDGSLKNLLASLYDEGPVDGQELAELREWFEREVDKC